ncbi:TonB-dependent receptor [Flavobacterium capsici]|uniref:TonB-dependent receptor n=1 Tax=Flavobacterium capsici TaxID=3075618 RepID=A0AA96EZ27_9FLAO|nr:MULTISPECIES: TonB-dependent receptor [unclassified Flavobacterium]WNM19899.1 TonB-dependent receptor [Flavobacterium sp. PMR2A8]WNM21288.1 TonB-dependent receptor [Flavobacterium sp. PMTSA4]
MKLKFLLITLFFSVLSIAQTKGTVTGVITDKDLQNETLPFANVVVKGTNIAVSTDVEGKYSFTIEAGNYTIEFSFLGYESVTKTVQVKAGETVTLNLALGSGSYTLQDVVIQNNTNRAKESALLLDQKNAVEMKQAIGAQELSRKGVSDVANAVVKTTGITKQEGSGNIFVRGLGDRYNSTTMNGLPIPSNDPEKKNLNLEIFSTDILEYVSIDKVYNSKLYGDFAGGNVDIVSKDYKGSGFLKFEFGSSVNTNAINDDDFSLLKGYNGFGFDNRAIPNNGLTQYNFKSLQLENTNPIAGTFGISGGKSFNIGEEGKLSLFATASFGNNYSSKADGTAKGGVNGNASLINKNFEKYTSISFNTNTTAMVNLGYKINAANKLEFNSVLINTSSLSKEEFTGYVADLANDGNGFIRRNKFEKNTLLINQLLGEHKLSKRTIANWGLSYNTIKGDMPDRTQNTLNKNDNGYVINSQSAPNNHRYFQNLTENEMAATASVDYKFKKVDETEYKGKLTLGYNGRFKTRDFEATQFNFKALNGFTNTVVDPNNLDAFYNQENFTNGYFQVATFRGTAEVPNALKPQTYNGEQIIQGGFLNTEYKFSKLTAVLGLRGEYIFQKVKWNTQLDPTGGKDEFDKIAFLPSLTLKYELTEKQNLRFGFSKTYTLPQFKERALFVYEDVTEVKVGNPDLYASDDYNFDLKWEFFPEKEEVISVTAFGKYIQNPMNEVTIASSTNDISYINTGDFGYVAGGEFEVRKSLLNIDTENSKKLTAGLNVSYLYTQQDLSTNKVIKETDYNVAFNTDSDKFTGASDLLLNGDISFLNEWNKKESNLTSTLSYTYFSDRVYALGTNDRGNLVDKAFGSLDLILKSKLNKNFGLGLVAKNLLDPTINRVQENKNGDVNVLSYKKGINLSLTLSYQF